MYWFPNRGELYLRILVTARFRRISLCFRSEDAHEGRPYPFYSILVVEQLHSSIRSGFSVSLDLGTNTETVLQEGAMLPSGHTVWHCSADDQMITDIGELIRVGEQDRRQRLKDFLESRDRGLLQSEVSRLKQALDSTA